MVVRTSPFGARAWSGRSFLSLSGLSLLGALLLASLLTPLTAQTPPAAEAPPAVEATTPPAPPAAQDAAAKQPVGYGRVVADKVMLRCWPSAVAMPPVYEDPLAKDQVVSLGRSENGFRSVIVPLGPLGYVSKRFAEASADGQVKTKGTKVSFRFKPRSTEPPVAQLEDGTALHVVGELDDWYQVRVPGIEAWVAEAEVQAIDATDGAAAKAYEEWRGRQLAEVQARLDAIAAKAARQAKDAQDIAQVRQVAEAFQAEMKKPVGEQQFEPLTTTLDKLVATFDEQSAGRGEVEVLKKRIETQRWLAEAMAIQASKPPAVEEPPPPKVDPLETMQAIGWLRYERRLGGPGVYFVEKGGQRQYVLTCNSGRYDLALFVGHEVGLNGPRRAPGGDAMSVLDVERLVVLANNPR
ncbi:MAG: hypothetical protein JNL12_22400 [Planctomycetes bacterium]|nr:hypothetical protein [Planctomycetota bacterium]